MGDGKAGGAMVRQITIEDERMGTHELGAHRAAIVLAFDDAGPEFCAVGNFSNVDVVHAAEILGLIAGTGLFELDGEGRSAFELLVMTAFLRGFGNVGRQAELSAASVMNEMGASDAR